MVWETDGINGDSLLFFSHRSFSAGYIYGLKCCIYSEFMVNALWASLLTASGYFGTACMDINFKSSSQSIEVVYYVINMC